MYLIASNIIFLEKIVRPEYRVVQIMLRLVCIKVRQIGNILHSLMTTLEKPNFDQLKTSLRFNLEGATSGTAWVTGIKVEIGSVATDWSPAP
ncbi:PblB [Streptococcus pneumoniae]|nr:PblB [Streptococcus pneumoniae]